MEAASGAFKIQEVPPEIRTMIFRSLPLEDVRKCRMTSKKWNDEIMADTLLMKKIWSEVPPSSWIEAVSAGNLPFFKEMMQFAANKNPCNKKGETPLHVVVEDADICRLLLANVEDKSPKDSFGQTPLHFSSVYGRVEVCRLLIEEGVDKDARDDDGRSPRDIAHMRVRWLFELFTPRGSGSGSYATNKRKRRKMM